MKDNLILYGGTYLNKGGAAITYGTLKVLKELGFNFSYVIDPEPFFPFKELNLIPIYRFSDKLSTQKIQSIEITSLAKPFFRCILLSLCDNIRQFKGIPIWHIGDSPFSDSRSALSIVGQIIALHSLKLVNNSTVIIGGVSLDYPKTPIGKNILPFYFKKYVDYIYTRGKYTSRNLEAFGVSKKKFSIICDFAFHIDRVDSDKSYDIIKKIRNCNRPKIALILRDYSQNLERKNYIKCIKELISILNDKNYDTYFIPTTYAYLIPENDLFFLENELKVSKDKIINIKDLNPHEIISVFSNFDIIISTRLHGAVLGTLAHIPTIHLYEGGKSIEVIGEVFEDLVPLINLHKFSNGEETKNLLKIIEQSLHKKSKIEDKLKECIENARNRSLELLKNQFIPR